MTVPQRRRRRAPAVLAAAALTVLALAAGASAALGATGDGRITTLSSGLFQPRGIAPEAGGTNVIVDFGGHRVRRVAANGALTTIAGNGVAGFAGDGGPATAAQLDGVTDVIVIPSGPYQGILVADEFNQRIRRIDPGGIITTVAGTGVAGNSGDGGQAVLAQLQNPRALSATPDGGFLIADELNHEIRQVAPDGTITRVAGTGVAGASGDGGPATSAQLRRPLGVLSLGAGRFVIADGYNDCVREVSGGTITTRAGSCGTTGFAGDGGPATSALLSRPRDVVATPDGGLYIADSLNQRIRRIAPDGVISTVAGTGVAGYTGPGVALASGLNEPSNLLAQPNGDLLVADTENGQLRRVQQPLATLGGLAPSTATAGSAAFALTVSGSGFAPSAVVLWNGSPRTTTRVDSTRLTAQITAADIASAGSASVSVRTSPSGGDTSAATSFVVSPAGGSGGGPAILAGNLTQNPGFEAGVTKWSCYHCTLAQATLADAPEGTKGAQITLGATFTSMALDDSPDTIASTSAGGVYSARAYVRAADAGSVGKTARLYLREKDSAGATLKDTAGTAVTLSSTFTPVTVTATALAAAHKMDVRVGMSSIAVPTSIYIDAVSVIPGTITPPPSNAPPVASFTVSAAPVANSPVTFTDTSTDSDGSIASRAWDTDNDGSFDNGTGATAQATFPAAGTYTVRLRATDDTGAQTVASVAVTVGAGSPPPNQPPIASFGVSAAPTAGVPVTFTDTSTDPDGSVASRAWDTDNNGLFDNGTGATAQATFPVAGTYTVRLRATDNGGAPTTVSVPVVVQAGSNQLPLASFSVSATPTAGSPVTFTDTSTDPDGTIAARAWDTDNDGFFDDGTGPTAQATFATSGTYTVRLQVTDNGGAPAVASVPVLVQSAGGGGVTIPAGNLTQNATFEAGVTKWSCYHCTLAQASPADAPEGTKTAQITLSATFTSMALDDSPDTIASTTAGGQYTGKAYVKAADAGSVGKTVRLYLREKDSAGTVLKDTAGTAITLSNTFAPITVTATALAAAHKMDVRVGMSSIAVPTSIYIDAVSVVPGAGGPPANQNPLASFTVSAAPTAGTPVTFTDTSTDPDGSIASRAWDTDNDGAFDDGTGATAQATFAAAGTYTVRLQVTDNQGATATASVPVTVQAAGNQNPLASFSVSPAPTAGSAVTFTDTSSDPDGSIASRAWDTDDNGSFDNGTGATAQATFPAAGTYTVRLQVTDNLGATAVASVPVAVQAAGGGVTIPAGNLTQNPGFESAVTKWSCYHCTLAQATLADAPQGTKAAQITLNATFTSMALDDSPDTIASTTAGGVYSGTAYVRAADAASVGRTVRLFLREKDSTGAVVKDTGGTAVTLSNTFTPITVSAAAVAAGHPMDVRVGMSSIAVPTSIYIDAVSVVLG